MDFKRLKLKRLLTISSRSVAALALSGMLLAACGDDDDDDGADTDATPTTEMTTPTAADETEDGPTATEATGTDGTEAEDSGTAAEETTESEDMGAGTESADATEAEDDGTPTEADEDMAGTSTEEDDEATGEETEIDGTVTGGVDRTATEDDAGTDATGTEDEDAAEGTSTSEGTASEDGGDTAELGETIELGDLSVTVEGVEDVSSTAGIVEPESGMRFVGVEVTVENTGSDEVTLFDVFSQMRLEDAAGEEFDVDLLASALLLLEGRGIVEPRIEPGSEVSGTVGFQVPEEGDDLMLVFESDSGETIEIDLSGGQ